MSFLKYTPWPFEGRGTLRSNVLPVDVMVRADGAQALLVFNEYGRDGKPPADGRDVYQIHSTPLEGDEGVVPGVALFMAVVGGRKIVFSAQRVSETRAIRVSVHPLDEGWIDGGARQFRTAMDGDRPVYLRHDGVADASDLEGEWPSCDEGAD